MFSIYVVKPVVLTALASTNWLSVSVVHAILLQPSTNVREVCDKWSQVNWIKRTKEKSAESFSSNLLLRCISWADVHSLSAQIKTSRAAAKQHSVAMGCSSSLHPWRQSFCLSGALKQFAIWRGVASSPFEPPYVPYVSDGSWPNYGF